MCNPMWIEKAKVCGISDNHNYIPVSWVCSPHMKQVTTLMCNHCLHIIELSDVMANQTTLQTSGNV
jgi:hypothetical protein